MSENDLQIAQQGYDAWNRGDLDWLLEHVTEDVEVQPLRDIKGFEECYRGHEGWREFWEAWHEVWGEAKIKVHRFQDMGDHGVLALVSIEQVGDGDWDPEPVPVSHWITFRDGKYATVTAMAPETAERRREART